MQLILASASPYRKAQLEQFGLSFEAIQPAVDEDALKFKGPKDLVELTRFLAGHKAQSLRARFPQAIILGSDQLAEVDGVRLDKPGTHQKAFEQLKRLQGRSHQLITSLMVCAPQTQLTFTDITTLHLRTLNDSEIEAYLQQDKPYDCAGSYKIERAGLALVQSLETKDPSAIQGLPLLSLSEAFRKLNIPLSEIWRTKL